MYLTAPRLPPHYSQRELRAARHAAQLGLRVLPWTDDFGQRRLNLFDRYADKLVLTYIVEANYWYAPNGSTGHGTLMSAIELAARLRPPPRAEAEF